MAKARATWPLIAIGLAVIGVWYVGAVLLNGPQVREQAAEDMGFRDFVVQTWSMERPVLPAPHQIVTELAQSLFTHSVTSPRNLLHHAWVTASAALSGLGIALALGLMLAAGIVHIPVLDRSLMPWLIASQTVPVLAIAPMVVVVLGNLGITGLLPKAAIAGYLAFFPITVGMVKGLRAADPLQIDLLRTYDARPWQVFSLLRFPASLSFLFPNLRVAMTLALVGAIVAELPTGAQAGLGARLLAGSYYGQTIQIWAALLMAAGTSMLGLAAVSLIEALVAQRRGGRL